MFKHIGPIDILKKKTATPCPSKPSQINAKRATENIICSDLIILRSPFPKIKKKKNLSG